MEGYELPPRPLRIHWRDTPGLSFVQSVSDFSTSDAVQILTSPTWFRLCFVRNPYSRLFSAYKQKVKDLASPWGVNATQKLPLAEAYDKPLADYVYQVFRNDFEAFGYHRNTWSDVA